LENEIHESSSLYKETNRSWDGRNGVELDRKAEIGQALDEPTSLRGGSAALEVSGAKILVESGVGEHVVGRRQDGGSNGAHGFLGSASSTQADELRI
jgi:hypothetical protein